MNPNLSEIKRLAEQIQPLINQSLKIVENKHETKRRVADIIGQNDMSKCDIQPIFKSIINHWPRHIDYIRNLEDLLPPLRHIDNILFPADKHGQLVQGISNGEVEIETRFSIPEFRIALIKELKL